jgi:hypothetical protein
MEKLGEDEFSVEDAQIISALAAQVGATYRGLQYEEIRRHAGRLK